MMKDSPATRKDQGARHGRSFMLLTNPATYDRRPLKEAHSLSRAGFQVTILAWDRESETRRDSVFPDGLVIKRMRVHAGHGTPFLTVPKLLLFYLWCLAHLVGNRAEVVHCHDVDTLPAGLAARLLKFRRPRLVYDMHDLPEAFLRFFPLTRTTQRVALAFAKKTADAVLVVNDRFVAHLGRLGFDRSRLVVVMNAPPAREGREPRRPGQPFNVLYYGWLGEERGVRLIVEAVDGVGGTSLTLAGRGELEPYVLEASARNPSIKYFGWLTMERLEPLIRQADLIPSLYEPRTKNAQLATPGKLLTSMSLSLPSLVPAGSYQAEVVEKWGCGVVVDWHDPEEVRGAIVRLSSDPEVYGTMAAAAFAAFRDNYSWEVMEGRLSSLYEMLIGDQGGSGPELAVPPANV